jgi:hypothetical protein
MADNGGNDPSPKARCIAGVIGAVIMGALAGIGAAPAIAPDFVIEFAVMGAAASFLMTAAALC